MQTTNKDYNFYNILKLIRKRFHLKAILKCKIMTSETKFNSITLFS